jgi:hypothetical protein
MTKKTEAFTTVTGLEWKAIIDENGFVTKVKMITPVGRGYYYSCLNEVASQYQELLNNGTLKTNM